MSTNSFAFARDSSNKGEVMNVHSVLDAGVAGYTPMKKRRIAASLKRARIVRLASVTCSHERKSESAARTHSRDGDSRSGRGS